MAEGKENPSGEQEAETRHGGGLLRWAWIAGLLVVLYVLSLGPMCKLCDKGQVSDKFLEAVYWPVIYAGDHFMIPHNFLAWYVHELWKAT